MSKLKNKKYIALLGIIVLVIGIISLLTYGKVDKYRGLVKVKSLKTSTRVLSSIGNAAGLESKGYDIIKYTLTYSLDEIDGVQSRDVVIKGRLTDGDFKYAKFKEITGDNYSSTLSEDGREIEITVNDVPLGQTQTLDVKIVVEGAPNGTKIKPIIEIKESTGSYTRANTEEIEVKTNSLQGKVTDKANNPISSIELSINSNGEEVKRTYTNDNGEYTFTDLSEGNYTIKVEEEIFELVGESKVNVKDNSELNLTVQSVTPYSIETHKYIKSLNLIVNGKEFNYSYKDAEKVIQNVKNAKTIEGQVEYKIVVKNNGEKAGTITQVIDEAGEGLKFNPDKNNGWVEEDGILKYKPIEGSSLKGHQTKEIKLILDITKTSEIKTYLNKLTAKGEIYEKVVYIIDGQKFSEEDILQGEKANKPVITLDNFTGWFTDKNYTNKYNFNFAVNKDLILYGYTLTSKCKVTFIDRGELYQEQEVTCGDKATKPTDPSHEGYEFKAWKTANDNTFDFNTDIESDITLYSSYDLINYNINYNYNGGTLETGKTNPSSYTIETPDFTINNPSKPGYRFIGWTERTGDTPSTNYTIRTGTTGDKTLTANYSIIEYDITYDLDGGNLEEGKTNKNKYTIETETFTLNNPSKEGYTFEGWTGTDLNTATKTVTIPQGSMGDRHYTATYKPIEYTITYEGLTNAEKTALSNPVKYTIETDTITLNNPTNRVDNDGDVSEIFVGWTGSGVNDPSMSISIPKGSTGNKTYTAHWIDADPDIYPITYELNGGTLGKDGEGHDITNPSSYTKHTNDFTLNNPKKKGYDFTGWSGTDLVGNNNTTVTIVKGSRGPRAYTAYYTPKIYNIVYNLDGGSLAAGATNPDTYTIETPDITLNDPSKLGYTFIGWEGTDVATPTTPVKILQGSTGDREYTAKYTKDKYNITYDLDGGTLEEGKTNPIEYYVDTEDFTLNNPSKTGYRFIGWTYREVTTPEETVTVVKGSTGDIHFVAHYELIEYNITYNLDGGNLAEGVTNPSKYTIETETFTLNNPTKEGAKFTGWTGTELSGKSTEVTITQGSTGDREYTATWGPNVYLVKFINNGNLYRTASVNYMDTVQRPTDPTKDNYSEFKYWSTENKSFNENPVEFDFSTQITQDYTLYAIYQEVDPPVITHTPTYWTNQNVTVTIASDHDDYTYMKKLDDGSYESYSGPFEVEQNGTVYAYSVKGSKQSIEVTHDITNIDKIKPRINNLSASGVNMTSFTINVAASDDESGIRSITLYKDDVLVGTYLYDDEDTGEKIKSVSLSNLEENTTYHIKAITTDKAGNESDAFEKDIKTEQLIVARIIGENNELWEEERYINFPSLKEAIEYPDCVSSQCTIQMVQGTNESNIVLDGQDITLDLNGKIIFGVNENYTIQNSGKFTIIDNNEDEEGILYNQNGTALVNVGENSVFTLGVNDEELNVSITKPKIVGKVYGVNKVEGKFNFYDGYIEGTNAIVGSVDDTPYLHNARVSSIAQSDATIKQKAILSKVADAEARIGSVYYTKLADAIDKSNIGTIETTVEEKTMQDSIITYGDYGFTSRDGVIVPEDDDHIVESKSIIPIDLTDATEDQVLMLKMGLYKDHMDGAAGSAGRIYITDELGTSSDVNLDLYAVKCYTDGECVKGAYSSYSGYEDKQSISLSKGKKYYLYLEGDVKLEEINIGTTSMKSITNAPDYSLTNDGILYGFEYDETTKTLRSNNNYKDRTTAYSYIEVDLTQETEEYELATNVTFDIAYSRNNDYGFIVIREDSPKYDPKHYNLYQSDTFVYLSSYYSYRENDRSYLGSRDYKYTFAPGKKYYVEFYYYKADYSTYSGYPKTKAEYDAIGTKDEFVINRFDVYKKPKIEKEYTTDDLVTPGDYGFRIGSNTTNCYVSSATNTTAHSYIKIDSSDVARRLGLQFYHSSNSDFYMAVTESTDIPTKDEAFYVGGSRYVSSTGGNHEDTYNVNLKTGKDLYLHFVYNRDSNNNCPSISSVKLFEGWGSTDEDIKTYGDAGFNSTSTSGYIYRYNDEITAGDAVDSYVKVDLRNATEDQVAYMTYYNYTTSVGSYVYVTDTPKDLTYNYVKTHKEETVFFIEQGQSYYYTGNKNYKSTSSYFLAHPMLLPKGRVYYIHLGGLYESSSGSYSGTGVYINSVTTQPLRNLKIHIGNTVKVLHGNKASGSAISDPNLVFDETQDNNIRYIGSDAKNYISFNNEKWRIIGLFDTEDENGNKDLRIKIVRDDPIDSSGIYDSSPSSNNNSGYGINEWSQADIMKLLNPGYDDESVGGSLYYNSGSGMCYRGAYLDKTSCSFSSNGLKDESKEFIDEVKWNTGAVTTTEFTAKELYEAERGTDTGKTGVSKQNYYVMDDVERTTSWVGKVGLIYPSDFVYSVDGASWSDDEGSYSYTRDECIDGFVGGCYSNASWMWANTNDNPIRTITPSSKPDSSQTMYVSPGKPSAAPAYYTYNINPVVYLSNKAIISGGNGTSSNPYTIELGESKNTDNDYGLVEKNQGYAQFVQDNTDDHNYRFIGADPNNYVTFNNETWRIIGIFKTEDKNGVESYRIKIMKKDYIGAYSYDAGIPTTNAGNGINEWSQADLMKLLNPGYTNNMDSLFKTVEIQGDGYTSYQYTYDKDDLVNNSLYWNKSSGLCFSANENRYKECDFSETGLSNDAKQYVDTVKWNLGAIPYNYSSLTPHQIYEYERGDKTGKDDFPISTFPADTVERQHYWYGKVAIPYASDFIMASGSGGGKTRKSCMTTSSYGSCSYNNNWMKSNVYSVTLSPLYGSLGSSSSYGYMNSFISTVLAAGTAAGSTSSIRPTLYLSPKTIISGGTGTSDDPYTIELGEEKNTIPYYGLVQITPEPGAQPVPEDYQDIETDDYNKIKGATLYGFAYDKDTNTYIPENASIKNSVASSTIEIDLTNETASKRLDIAHNYTHNYFTFLVITETPDPIFYHPDMPTGYGNDYMNKNLTAYNQTIYLDPGKKYYIHLGYMNWDYYYIDSCNSQYGAWTTQLTFDSGNFSNNNIIKTYTYERNDDVDTVQILKNISLDYNLEIEKNRSVVLDLNGYTLNSVTNGPMVRNYGELEIIDSKLESDPASGGKMINNNGSIVLNNADANLILTSGNIESTNNGVDNMGNLTMKENFTISNSNIGINNQDGIIDDMAGKITASNIGIDNEKVNMFNGDDSGTIKSMSGPLEINSLTGTGIKNTDKVSNATISANTGIDSQDQDLSINNTLIKDCRSYGINAKYLTSASDVTITCTNAGTGIYAGIDDDSEIESVTSTAGTALYLKSGNLVYDDNSELMLNGGISNAGDMVINLLEREVTDSIVNNGEGTMVIKSLADTDTNNLIVNNENGILTMNEKPITVSNILARGAHEDIKKVTTNEMTVKGKDANFEDGSILRKLIVGFDTAQLTNSNHILNIKDSTVGTSSTEESYITTYNTGTINSDNSTFYGRINNLRHGTLNLNNNSEVNNLVSAGYYSYSYSSRYSYYYGQTEVNVNNSKINGSVVIGTQYPNQCSGSSCSYSAFYDNFNLSNNSEVLGSIQNYKTGYTNINDSKTSTIQNDGHLTLGTKGDGMNRDSVYTEKITNNNYVDNYASPTAEVKLETVFNFYDGTINSTDDYPIYSPLGEINEIENNYYLDQENDGEKNVVFLNDNIEVCKIGDTKYPSIGAAIEAAENNPDTPVTIEVIRDHLSLENIVNNKNVLIDFKGFTVNEYKKDYIVNYGNMTLKAVLNEGYVIHGGAKSTDEIPASTKMGDMQINNYGNMVIDDLTTEGIGYSSNGTFRMKNGGTHEVAAYTVRSSTVIEDGAMDLLMNEGDCLVEDIRVSMIHNSGNIIVERNTGNSDELRTEFTNFNKREYSSDPEKNVWIKRGSYKFIKQQAANGISYPNNQTIKVGIPVDSEEQSELVTVKDYINLEYGSLVLNNAKVNNEIRNTYSVKSNSSTINDSTVVNRNSSSSNATYYAVYGNSTITNSTITCSALYTNYPCIAVYSSTTITNSEINGTTGVSGSVVMNSGTITGKTYGIKAECANVSVINGTVKAESNNAIDTYQNSSSYSYCNNSINIGTNSDKTVLGNPSIIATNGYGVNASDLVTVTYANGTINAKTYGIRANSLSSYRNNRYYYRPAKVYIGTVLVDGEETPNPTITATNYGAYLYGVVDGTNKSEFVMARGSVSAYYPIYVSAGANTTNVVIGDTNDSDVSKTNPHIVATSSYPAITQSTNSFYIYDGLIEAAKNKSYSGNITGVEPGYTLITEASGSNREKTYLDAPKIAKVNNVEYDSINEAVEAANNGDTIEILTAFTFVESISTVEIPAGKEVTIDFKNFEINNKSTKTFINNSGNVSIINIKNTGSDAPIINNGTMDITGASIVSSITNKSDLIINSGTYGSVTNNSQLNVNAGTIANLINNNGIAELDGGTITKLTQRDGTVTSKAIITTLDLVNGTVTLEDGAITNTTVKDGILNIGIKDGVVSETAPSLSKGITFPTENGVVNFYDGVIGNGQTTTGGYYITSEVNRDFFNDIETGYNIVEGTDTYKGLVLKQSNIIKNLDTEAEYTSIQDAIDAASSGDTLQLMKTYARTSSETTYTIPAGKNIKFDFNGNSIYTTSTLFENNGSLEIKTSEASLTNKYYLGIVNNGTLTTSGTLGLFNLVELTNNGNTTIENVNMNTFNYTNNVGATLTLNSVLYRKSTEVNNGTETITDSTLYTTDMTNSGTLTYNTVTIYTANSDIKNSGTMDCNNITFYLRDFVNESTGVINLNSGLVENTTTSTRYITNRGILNSDKTNIKNITVKDSGTFNLKGMPDNLTQIVVPVQVNSGGAYYQTGGVNDSTIYGFASDSVISIKDSTVNTVDIREGADVTVDNSKVTNEITTNNGSDNSIVNIKNNSEVQRVRGNSAPTTNFVVNVEDSILGTFDFTANANKYASDVTINLKNSTLRSTSNGYYSEGTSSSNMRYFFRAKIDINAEDSDITGLLYVDNITMNGGSARAIRNSHSIPTPTYTEQLTKTCNLTDVTVEGNVICSDSIESTSTSVGGNIKTSILTLDRSDITGTVTAHQAEFTDSNVTDNVYITDKGYSGGSLVMNSGTVSNGIDGANASVTVKSGTVTKSGDNSVAINAKTVIIGDNDENVSTTDPVITADSSSINATDLYFYDGILTGGTVAYDVNHAYYPASYKTNIITVGGRSVATLVPLGEDETVADIDGNKFYADLLAAINDCTDGGTIKLHRDIELDEDIAWSDKSIIIDLNNHEILNIEHLLGSYTTIDSTDPETGGAIYRFLANITGTEINPKNIIVYQMQDGNPLEADETYKLYKLIDSQYKLVKVNEENIGNYTVGNNEEIIRTVNGRVYLNGIGEGTYKLVSNNDREISFVISDNSISSNIKENPNYTSGTFIVSAVATLILTLQTGVIRYPYITVIIILLFLVGVSYILKKEKKQLE